MNKIEHAGPKRGRGGFYGPKKVAKRKSSRRRRELGKRVAAESRDGDSSGDNKGSAKTRRG